MKHICFGNLTIVASDNGLSSGRCQAIIGTNAGILLIGTLGTNSSEILSEIHSFLFKKMHLKMASAKWRLFCLGLNELIPHIPICVGSFERQSLQNLNDTVLLFIMVRISSFF